MATSPAAEIVEKVGGPANIESLTHCATRLRFQLRDASAIDKDAVEAIPGVLGAVPQSGERYQVVIGGAVQNVYNDIMALPSMSGADERTADDIKAAERAKGPRGKFSWLDNLFEFLSNSFRPILGALLAAGFFITFMALMATTGVIPAWNDPTVTLDPSWQFVNLAWQCIFVFLPLMVAYNASKQLGADPWVGFGIMAVTMLPGFTKLGEGIDPTILFGSQVTIVPIFGLPLPVVDYGTQVFPPLLMAAVLGPLWKLLNRIIPSNVQLIFVPFLSMLIMIPLTAFLIGPLGVYVGAWLGQGLLAINDFSPLIFAIIIPLAYPFMVPLGLHWPINAIMLANLQSLGHDFIQGPMGAWNFACFGATAGVLILSIRQRDTQMRQTATGALAAGLLGGISEPSLYGIHLRFKRIYPRMLVGCLVGGVIIGLGGGVTTNAFVFTSLLTIPAFNNIPLYALGVGAAFIVAMILVMISGYRTPEQQVEFEAQRALAEARAHKTHTAAVPVAAGGAAAAAAPVAAATATAVVSPLPAGGSVTVFAPLDGTIVPLSAVPDPVFAGGAMGPGVAIEPSGDTVYAPGPGRIEAAQPTGHAFGLVLDGGVELLIHVGIDTVNLKGEGFDVKVKAGEYVDVGTPLVTFDRAVIEKAGYPLITPVIVLNADDFGPIETADPGPVSAGQQLLSVSSKVEAADTV